jgi:hypothetical protein
VRRQPAVDDGIQHGRAERASDGSRGKRQARGRGQEGVRRGELHACYEQGERAGLAYSGQDVEG